MKNPLLTAAIGLLAVSNAFVVVHAALNRSGEPEAEVEITAREVRNNYTGSDDSNVTLTLVFQNVAGFTDWFDAKKLEELGFDTSVPAGSVAASRYYTNSRSREIFVALEHDGPAWQKWLTQRESQMQKEAQYGAQMPLETRMEIERQTSSRLIVVDAALDPVALRAKYPDRKHVLILRGLARIQLDYPAALRGVITRIATDSINVPEPLRRFFESQTYYSPYTLDGQQVKINPPPYAVTVRVGSRYEPWVSDVRALR
jgi:hypothetical protein